MSSKKKNIPRKAPRFRKQRSKQIRESWVKRNSLAIGAIGNILLVLVTAGYVITTFCLLKQTIKQTDDLRKVNAIMTRPYISRSIPNIKPENGYIVLYIENENKGETPALNVIFRTSDLTVRELFLLTTKNKFFHTGDTAKAIDICKEITENEEMYDSCISCYTSLLIEKPDSFDLYDKYQIYPSESNTTTKRVELSINKAQTILQNNNFSFILLESEYLDSFGNKYKSGVMLKLFWNPIFLKEYIDNNGDINRVPKELCPLESNRSVKAVEIVEDGL